MEDEDKITYKAVGIITWEIDLSPESTRKDASKKARQVLDDVAAILPPGMTTQVRIDRIKRKRSRIIRLAEFEPQEILSKVRKGEKKHEIKIGEEVYHVRLNSKRYFVFHNNLACVACGLEGTKMILERQPSQEIPHFNLYAEENEKLILMTKDHIHSRASGGRDNYSNFQTMCSVCNNLKGPNYLPLRAVRELRDVYNSHKGLVSRRKFSSLVYEIKKKYEHNEPFLEEELADDEWIAADDLNIYESPDGLVGSSAYDFEDLNWVACIKSGRKLNVVEAKGNVLKIKLDGEPLVLNQGLVRKKGESDER
jgi:hypothetical protein